MHSDKREPKPPHPRPLTPEYGGEGGCPAYRPLVLNENWPRTCEDCVECWVGP